MAEIVDVLVVDLLLDGANPRLETDQAGQQEMALSLTRQQGDRILKLAEDIVDFGLDPTTLVAVVALGGRLQQYKVIEGNRRVLALKALETPSLVSPALSPKNSRKLSKLSSEYAKAPRDEIPCILFKNEDEALHWLELRHTGANQGRGVVEWGAEEKDRFRARHSGSRKPAGQVIDFVDKFGSLSADAKASSRKILTNLERLLSSPEARRKLGVDLVRGQVVALHPRDEVAKSLTRVVQDLKTGGISVPDLYHADDRKRYADSLPRSVLPLKKSRLPTPVSLAGLTAGKSTPVAQPPKPKKPGAKRPTPRTRVIPSTASLNVTPPRLNAIQNELLTLVTEQYPNACAVLLRVFIELSIDHFIADRQLTIKGDEPLAKRLKAVAAQLQSEGAIDVQLRKAMDQVANGPSALAPGVSTFNQYVHNKYTHPKPSELFAAWDEVQPLMEQVWL